MPKENKSWEICSNCALHTDDIHCDSKEPLPTFLDKIALLLHNFVLDLDMNNVAILHRHQELLKFLNLACDVHELHIVYKFHPKLDSLQSCRP